MKAARTAAILVVLGGALAEASAQDAAPASETSVFVFNTLLLVLGALFAMLAAAGLALLAAGLVRAKNAGTAALAVAAAFAVAAVATWVTGAELLYGVEPGGFLGPFGLWSADDPDPVGEGVAASARFLFAAALAGLAVAIVAGAVAERARLGAFLCFAAVFTGLIFPVGASWHWGGGYLAADWRFVDSAGAAVVHVAGGAAALAGCLIVGARRGRFQNRRPVPIAQESPPAAALGAVLVWLGLLGTLAGAQPGFSSVGAAIAVAGALVNANLAAAGGVIAAVVMGAVTEKRVNWTAVLNGAVGGLVSISAEPAAPALWQALLIGAFGGVIVASGATMLERMKIDDAAGGIPAHLLCGAWGTLVVPWTNAESSILGQIVGLLMISGFSFALSALVWIALKYSFGVRVGADQEQEGLDLAERRVEPDFTKL